MNESKKVTKKDKAEKEAIEFDKKLQKEIMNMNAKKTPEDWDRGY